jgi:hypothetical protein
MSDRIPDALQRAHADLHNTDIDVYVPTETYSTGDGYDVTYPGSPTDTIPARVEAPSEQPDRDRGGTTSDADAEVYVRDDTGISWVGYGESGEAAVELVDTADGRRYVVEAVTDEHNGLLVLEVAETDG